MAIALSLVAGLLLLAFGGEAMVRGAVDAARALGVPALLAGLVVGVGTSAPELATSVTAALRGAPGLALGGVLGSNVANTFLVLGAAGVVSRIAVAPDAYWRDAVALAAASAATVAAALSGEIGRATGVAFLALLAVHAAGAVRDGRAMAGAVAPAGAGGPAPPRAGLVRAALLASVGLGTTLAGAWLLVRAAVDLAEGLGVAETVIGLSVVALGTSLPELAACVAAARQGQGEVALGNVLGSNLFNLLGILGVTALVRPIPVEPSVARVDVWVLAGSTLALLVVLRLGWRLRRREGALLLVAYAAYLVWLAATAWREAG